MKEISSACSGISLLALICASSFISTYAYAQSQASAGDDVLEEIVVTAQRRETSLQRTALAASVITGEGLVDRGITGLTAIQYAVPSLNISDFGSANVFNIRGIGRTKVDIEIPSGVVIYSDGVPTLAGYFQNEPYFDMASVEVLRGPQGTIAGKSASGGAIFMNTRSPELGESGGNLEVGFGEHNLIEAKGAVNIPVNEVLAFRAAINFKNRDDYYDEISGPYTGTPGEQSLTSLRLGMLVSPNDQLQILAKLSWADLDFGGNVTSSFGDPIYSVPQDAPFAYEDESLRFVLDIDYAMNNGIKFSSLTGYQELDTVNNLDVNGSEPLTYWFKSAGKIDLTSQEFNLVSSDDQRLRWVLGGFWQNQKSELLPIDQYGFTFIGNGFALDYPWLGSPWIKDEDDWAVFGHLTFDLSDALELEFGVRYSDYEMSQTTEYMFGFGDSPPFLPFPSFDPAIPSLATQTLAEDSVDWKVGLNWSLDDTNFLYALFSRGHTTGSVNIFPPFDPYKEMEVQNFDAGWKAEFSDGRVQTQVSAYYENIEGYQAAFIDLDIPNSAGQVQNASSDSKIYGLEVTGRADFDFMAIDFGASYNKSELGDFNNITHPLSFATVNLTGGKFPMAPEYTANLGLEFRADVSADTTMTARIDGSFTRETQADLFDDFEFLLDDRYFVNLQLRFERDDWYSTIWMTNATNTRVVAAIQNQGSLYYAAPPRQTGIRIGRNF
jgi:iron complex outermembrane receptor protein